MMRNSLFWRITYPYILLAIVMMGVLSLFLTGFVRGVYLERTETALFSGAHVLREEIRPLIAENPQDLRIDQAADQFGRDFDARVTIILADGTVVGESEKPIEEMESHFVRPEVQQALLKKEDSEIRYSDTLKAELVYAAVPVLEGEHVVAIVRLATPFTAVQGKLNQLYGSLLLATGIATALVVLFAFWITRYTLKPLKNLSQAVAQMTSGALPDIAEPSGKDEIGRLQSAFKHMSHELNARIDAHRSEQNRLEAVLINMTDAILIADAGGVITLINPAAAEMFKTSIDEALGKTLIEVLRHHQLVELWRKCQITNQQQISSIELTTDRLFIQGIATPLSDFLEGSILLVFQDLTRVRKLETVRRDFVSNVSHELRTPLASLKALTETLKEGALDDPPAAQRFLSQMDGEIDNLTQIVQELLELSKIESGRVPIQRQPISPCELMNQSVERMKLQAERAGLTLRVDCASDLLPVRADYDRIEQVLVNLIHNAVKFTRPGGEIVVSARPEGSEMVFSIRDTGVGIAPEDLERIFERFYKADRSRSSRGTGLGLSIARHTVESHGGRIWAESEVGQGSTFYFTLPSA